MIRFIVNAVVFMVAAAIGILVADIALDGMSVEYPLSFLTAAVVFGLLSAIIEPLLGRLTRRSAEVLTGGVGLFTALISLFITSIIVGGLALDSFTTWLLAALVIWLASMIAGFILKVTVAKRFIEDVRDGDRVRRGDPRVSASPCPRRTVG